MKNENQFLYQIIFQIRSHFPNDSFFSLFNLLLKSFGLFIYTHNIKGFEDSNITIHKFFLNFIVRINQLPRIYEKFSIAFFVFLLAYLIFITITFLLYRRIRKYHFKQQSPIDEFLLKKKKSKYYNRAIHFISIILLTVGLISQHLIEMLLSGIALVFFSMKDKTVIKYETPTILGIIPLGIINIISVLIISFLYLLFIGLFIQKSKIINIGYKTHCSKCSIILAFFTVFLQGIYSITSSFENKDKELAQLIMNIIIVIFLLFDILMNLRKSTINSSFFSKCIFSVKLDCFYSGVIEIFLYFLVKPPISQQMSIFKQIVEILFIILTFIFAYYFVELRQIKELSQNIFNQKNSKLSIEHLITYFNLLQTYFSFDSSENFHLIFDIFHEHIIKCTDTQCPCQYISSFDMKTAESGRNSKIEKLFKEMIIIGEQEINNLIVQYMKEQKYENLEELCLLHIDYMALIKHDFIFSYYLSHSYYTNKPNGYQWTFFNRYYLYEIKKKFIKSYVKKRKTIPSRLTCKKLNISSTNASTIFCDVIALHDYLITINTLFKCIHRCCHNLENIIVYLSFSNIQKKTSSSVTILGMFTENIEMNDLLYKTFNEYFINKRFKSVEINYLISNYLLLYHGEIPKKYKNDLKICLYYSSMRKEFLLYNQYSHENDIIITSMNNNDSFQITYASQYFCDQFNWTRHDLINNDFNCLLPKHIGMIHNIYMKMFALFDNNTYTKISFIADGSETITHVSITAKKMLKISNGFYLIFIITKHKPKTQNDKNYHILLDFNFNVLNIEESFVRNFFFTLKMFNQLKINFTQLFGLNQRHLTSYFKKQLKSQIRTVSLSEIVKSITIYNTIPNAKLFNYRCFNSFQLIYHKGDNIEKIAIVTKQDFCLCVCKLIQSVNNLNLDNSMLERFFALQNRFSKSITTQELNEEFIITIILKNLNSLFYYVVLIEKNFEEKTDNFPFNLPHTYSDNESCLNSISHLNDFVSPKISAIKKKKKLLDNMNLNISSKDKSPKVVSSVRFMETSQVSMNKSINTTNLKIINSSQMQISTFCRSMDSPSNRRKKKSKIKDFRKFMTQSFENWSLSVVIFIIALLFILSAVYYYYSLELSWNIFYINYISFVLKDDLVFSSLYFLRDCLIKDNLNAYPTSDISWKFKHKNSLFLNHIANALLYVNHLNSYNQINTIYQILYNNSKYKYIRDDWVKVTYNSSLTEELYKVNYMFSTVINSNEFHSCGVEKYSKGNFTDPSRTPYIEEKLLYYINNNVLKTLINQLNKFSNSSLLIFSLIHDKAMQIYFILYIITLVFCFLLYVLMILILIHDKLRIKHILINIYIMEHEENNILIKNLFLLKTVSNEFNKVNCHKYEESLEINTVSMRKKKSKEKLLNFTLTLKQVINNRIDTSSNEAIQLFRLSFENLKHFSNLTEVPLINKAFFVTTVLFVLNFFAHIILMLYFIGKYQSIKFQNDIGTNIIGKIPMFCQMLLYSITSIIQNDPFYIYYELKQPGSQIPNNYNVSIDMTKDSIYSILKNSNYVFLYYKFSLIQMTIEKYFEDQQLGYIFPESIHWNMLFNQQEYFPIYSSLGFTMYYTDCSTLTECFTFINKYSKENLYVKNNISEKGMNSLFNLIVSELNAHFIDFRNNYSKETDSTLLLADFDYWIILENTLRGISTASYILNIAASNDIMLSYSLYRYQGLLLSFSLTAFSLLSICTLIIILLFWIRRYIMILETVGEKISKLKQIHSI